MVLIKILVELAKNQKRSLEKIPGLEEELKVLLIPKDPQTIKTLSQKCVPELVVTLFRFVEDMAAGMYTMYFKTKSCHRDFTDLQKRLKVTRTRG